MYALQTMMILLSLPLFLSIYLGDFKCDEVIIGRDYNLVLDVLKEHCHRDFCCYCFNSTKITAFCLLSWKKYSYRINKLNSNEILAGQANHNNFQMKVDPRSYERNYMQLRKEA